MRVVYLRALTRAALISALTSADMWADSRFKPSSPGEALDEIGPLYAVDGTVLATGHHANLLLEGTLHSALSSIQIATPVTPSRIFAGWV